jgi:hypothetical protein
MQTSEIEAYARQLYDQMGAPSIAHAAQKAAKAVEDGNEDDASNWRRIEEALMQMRGPHQG